MALRLIDFISENIYRARAKYQAADASLRFSKIGRDDKDIKDDNELDIEKYSRKENHQLHCSF